ncbi:MAG: hypothetical protein QOG20_49 [Pseudonocardiales bacterium]|jgi:DNA-binding CsgD family transcriptional regulator|uniref:LuxR C-terminal-related transcriptional regulator n=1 Tax=Pseudonocardia sp. TaxID=60912 RepID=UPI0026348ADE|nr:LuxR C-terminal-related transcriptional regulator [Pseudonocardia sp.]MCW2720778.1 modulated transcriptional regulator, LuxR family [Pseudonocardia sp.]MDT7617657.1 hypothetical protein [Pseudonocardiales bacterium]MDT7704442.1 hypothetical protein [Pseudonocardiales bacterium]
MNTPTGTPHGPAEPPLLRATGSVADEVRNACTVLQLAESLTAVDCVPAARFDAGSATILSALDIASAALVESLADPTLHVEKRARLCTVLARVGRCRTAVGEAETARRGAAAPSVTGVLDRLRSATRVGDILTRAPAEVARVGYGRCLVSRIDDGCWVADAAHVDGDSALAEAIIAAGSASPRWIDSGLLESELVRRRSPMLVSDPQNNPRVHRELVEVTGTKAYIAAPFVVGRAVVGFVHADTGLQTGSVDGFDRDVLGMITECLGFALERAVYHQRLQSIRQTVSAYSASVTDMVDELLDSEMDHTPGRATIPTGLGSEVVPTVPVRPGREAVIEVLTAREREVIERMADGDTNARIASSLFISEATVKAHVKHILRKLGAANRAAAVSHYFRG